MDEGFDRLLRYRAEQGVATLTLARPEKRNALDLQAFDELGRVAARAADDPEVRVVVVRGEGPSFCAGIDVGMLVEVVRATGRRSTG
jgi:enoyl-CoA hydratase/carnithine racemase